VLTADIWREIKKWAAKAKSRKAAIAYVTKDLIGFKAGDILIVDASKRAIRSGQTDAPLLRNLNDKGVAVHSQAGLHSKAILLGPYAIIGSANMSGSGLIEASVITDNAAVTSGVASFIKQYSTARSRLSRIQIAALCRIKVVRTGWPNTKQAAKPKRIRRLGNSTWIIGVKELIRDPTANEQRNIDRARKDLKERLDADEDDYGWIRWGKKSKFSRECRQGDTLIQIWNMRHGKRRYVTRRLPVLLKRNEPTWVRFYIGEAQRVADEVNWARFQRILKAAKYSREVRPFSVQLLDAAVAEVIDRKWIKTS
jgi:hypothetical protein